MVDRQRSSTEHPRVGFITESFIDDSGALVEGGAERHLLHLASLAVSLGAEVTVYQRGDRYWQGTCDGIRVSAQLAPLLVLGRTLARRATADGCTHLHFQYLERVPWGLSGARVSATSHAVYWDIPYVDRYHQWYPGGRVSAVALPAWRLHQSSRCLLAVGRCERVLATDTSLLRLVQCHRPALRERVEVVMNFTDLVGGSGLEAASADGHPALQSMAELRRQGHVLVLVPRNLSFVRGGAWLCDIVERTTAILPSGAECHFFLTGVAVDVYGGARRYRQLLQRQIEAMSDAARRRLHLFGGLPRGSMLAAYVASDIVLIPTFAHEGSSLAALEAMGVGVPVVATNVGGLNDIVLDGITGLVAPPDPQALSVAVVRLARDPTLRARLGMESKRVAAAAFTQEKWQNRVESFARQVGWAADGGRVA
jgi:glycosyltransferase involved in cell wall biosynthesis